MSSFLPNFASGYYSTVAAIIIIILFAIPYQFSLLHQLYNSRTKSSLKESENLSIRNNLPIHWKITVWNHKFWNYMLHIIGVGDMSAKEAVLLAIYLGLNTVFLFIPFEDQLTHDIVLRNNRFGWVGLTNAAFVFPLATRNSVFVHLLGIPFERIITFHRWVGRIVIFMIMFHGGSHITYRWQTVTHDIGDLIFTYRVNLTGFLSFFGLFVIGVTSHSLVRRRAFEVFYYGHFFFIMFLLVSFLHDRNHVYWLSLGFLLYVIDRIIRFVIGYKETNITSIKALEGGVTRIAFTRQMKYKPGQYIFVHFPQLSKLQWHPVSLSSAPSLTEDSKQHHATIHLKSSGDFTESLFKLVRSSNNGESSTPITMRVEGPYGRPSLNFQAFKTVVLIGGGIGVTPIMSLLQDLVDRQVTGNPITTQSIFLIWTVPNLASYSWFESEIQEVQNKFSALPTEKYRLNIKIFVTRPKESLPADTTLLIQGRPSFDTLLSEIKNYHGSGDIAIAVCGPAVMLKEVQQIGIKQSDQFGLFKIHKETFAL
ncbi:13358_t:CDS:2 [Ambispora gerdemannii]|uniref:13358_t:CDS:1 n=1 Tax=Ambispora gerdemannii TaxID=144530 RepID=A0A9N8WK96_9GLOM|nr:13358_t:CDS:2 [Ambispora gerdemannii]